eukprot:CAMPEP_0201933330 /NCGR_PEP_ID=MMETSP0903-20130614/31360_1 /ASSEMBLY_ACC=CAM_ASM_000552 /TAXON_ID=420261 /ORGANISM="Thalassiosira antarctica, Strain CCMP982" /LENGTH=69 /DNA_ID=CAMNT_0048473245 /DNA_START=45 /DNA_END=251 /DNA_ORIENTATION=-
MTSLSLTAQIGSVLTVSQLIGVRIKVEAEPLSAPSACFMTKSYKSGYFAFSTFSKIIETNIASFLTRNV